MKAPPLRVLLTADAVGGVWQYATDLARALGPCGVEATIALLGPAPGTDQRRLADGVRLIETGLALDWLCDSAEPVRTAGHTIAALAAAEGFDLVQLNMPTLGADTRFAMPTVAVTHGCVATWWEAAHGGPLDPAYHWHRAMMADGLRAATRVVAPSTAYAATVARLYDLPRRPDVVHNGRRPLAVPQAASHDFALTAGRLWDRVKNAALLDRVAARLPFPFVAAGETTGPHGERLALDHLVLPGHLDEAALAAQLAARPVFVSAARFEPFGLAVLEAAAAGCPLVLSDTPTFRELWDGAAVFIEPDDEPGFTRAIEEVVGDEGRRRALGHAARVRAGRYTPQAMAASMARLFAELAPRHIGRAAA